MPRSCALAQISSRTPWDRRAPPAMLCVFSISISAGGRAMRAAGTDGGSRMSFQCRMPSSTQPGGPGSRRTRPAWRVPNREVRARFANHFLAMLGVDLDGDGVAHGAGGNKEAGFFAHNFSGTLFQTVDGGVFAVYVVADFGFGHGAAHRGSGSRDGVAAEVDHVAMNSAKTSFESKHAAIGQTQLCAVALPSRPSAKKRWMGACKLSPFVGPAAECLRASAGPRRSAPQRDWPA